MDKKIFGQALEVPKAKKKEDLHEVIVEQTGSGKICNVDLNQCLKYGTVIGSVALNYDKEGSDLDIVIFMENVPEGLLEEVYDDGICVDYILEVDDVDPNSWFSVKLRDEAGITINLIVCYDEVAEFKWVFSAEVCKVADRLMTEFFAKSPFTSRDHRAAIYQQSCAMIRSHMEE